MGVDSKAFMKQGINIIQLTKYLESKYKNVNVKSNETCDYIFYVAYFKDGEDNRALFVHLIDWEDEDNTYPVKPVKGTSVSLSLGYWGNSVKILTEILQNFGGGFLLPSDSMFDGTGWKFINGWEFLNAENNAQTCLTDLEAKVYQLVSKNKKHLNNDDMNIFNFIVKHVEEIKKL